MEAFDEELKGMYNQGIPLLADFLKLAVTSGRIILFDFKELPDNHPHAQTLVNATLKAISEAGMLHENVGAQVIFNVHALTTLQCSFIKIHQFFTHKWFIHVYDG